MITWLRRLLNAPARTSPRRPAKRTRLGLETLEKRDVPAALDPHIVIPYYNGTTDATFQLLSAVDQSARFGLIDPFPGYHGKLSVAAGDVNGDGIADAIVGAQAPNGHVKVFDGASGALIQSFFSFPGFNGAVNVGSADVNGDGRADVLVSADALNGHVKAFSGDGGLLASFYAFPGFLGTTSVTGADFNHDGHAEIVVGAGGPSVGGRVALFEADGSVYSPGFYAFPGYSGPISVAAGDVTGEGVPDIVVAAGPGSPGGPVVVRRGTDFAPVSAFYPYAPTVTNGSNVQLADANGDGVLDIQVTLQGGGYPGLTAFNGAIGRLLALSTGGQGTDSSPDTNAGGGDFSNTDSSPSSPVPSTTDQGTGSIPAPTTGDGDSSDTTDSSSSSDPCTCGDGSDSSPDPTDGGVDSGDVTDFSPPSI